MESFRGSGYVRVHDRGISVLAGMRGLPSWQNLSLNFPEVRLAGFPKLRGGRGGGPFKGAYVGYIRVVSAYTGLGFPKIRCTFWGPHNTDCNVNVLGSIAGPPPVQGNNHLAAY